VSCAIGNGDKRSVVWTLRVGDLSHREVVVAKVRFSDEPADSCIGGNWKRLVVDSSETKDPTFFPVSEPLSYEVDESELTIGRNGTCDSYPRLKGKFDGVTARGAYFSFGISGGRDRGEFTLTRNR
jgi:hypothetical protein